MGHGNSAGDTIEFTQEFWDDRYRSAGRLWSGQPNPQLVARVGDLPPGEALDAGCGEGADAVWLASRGWTVTGADISAVALERAAAHAAEQGAEVAGRITWERADLQSWDPGPDRFDLVSAQYLHLPAPALNALNRRLAAAVRPGGTLLIIGHHPDDLAAGIARHAPLLFTPDLLAAALDDGQWDIVADAATREMTSPEGTPVTATDAVLCARRRC
ncbi:MAG: class I SAM-dependent methyltransferase [Streptosporangiaceae bacterium]